MSDEDQISVDLLEEGSSLSLSGRITVRQATELQEAALSVAAEPRDASLDCTHLTHLDTAAVQVLIALRNEFASSSTEMRVHQLDPSVQQTLDETGLWARLAS